MHLLKHSLYWWGRALNICNCAAWEWCRRKQKLYDERSLPLCHVKSGKHCVNTVSHWITSRQLTVEMFMETWEYNFSLLRWDGNAQSQFTLGMSGFYYTFHEYGRIVSLFCSLVYFNQPKMPVRWNGQVADGRLNLIKLTERRHVE